MNKKMIMTGLMIIGSVMLVSAQSTPNSIEDDFATAMRGFYLWRCGMPVSCDYQGNHYENKACHLDDGYCDYIGLPGVKKDGTQGWHDAGDMGKYTVNAALTVGTLFYAWEHFGDKIKKVRLNLPKTAKKYPEFLEELKWETDFLLKMQYPDGSGRVSHKLTTKNFVGFKMPYEDKDTRYFAPWSSAATADFAAVMAMAARYFRPYDKSYANKCLEAANLSFDYLMEHPENVEFQQGDFTTGAYITGDWDDRIWAAAEIWETTGREDALRELEKRLGWQGDKLNFDNWDWNNMSNFGAWTYAQSSRPGRNPELLKKVRDHIDASAQRISDNTINDLYGYPLLEYFWGCNGAAARTALNLHMAEISSDLDYEHTRQRILDYLLGNNYYGRSFVTGIGPNPPMDPHDSRSMSDGIEAPWPGYLVGGGHTSTDWVDTHHDATRNEIAINWQAALVYLMASLLP